MRLIVSLGFFTLSFLTRGCWDISQFAGTIIVKNNLDAIAVFITYFVCEWIPLFIVYLHHFLDFFVDINQPLPSKTEEEREQTFSEVIVRPEKYMLIYSPGRTNRFLRLTLAATNCPHTQGDEMFEDFIRGEFDCVVRGTNFVSFRSTNNKSISENNPYDHLNQQSENLNPKIARPV